MQGVELELELLELAVEGVAEPGDAVDHDQAAVEAFFEV